MLLQKHAGVGYRIVSSSKRVHLCRPRGTGGSSRRVAVQVRAQEQFGLVSAPATGIIPCIAICEAAMPCMDGPGLQIAHPPPSQLSLEVSSD
jgi:hypothetical protein